MAVIKPFDHRGIAISDAYWRPNYIKVDTVRSEIAFDIEVYASAAARQKTSKVHALIRAAAVNERAKRADRQAAEENALAVAKDNPQTVTPVDRSGKISMRRKVSAVPAIVREANAAAEAARLAHEGAQEGCQIADHARATVGPLEVYHRALTPEVAAKLIADKATHDEIVAAIYAQEKADGRLLAGGRRR